MSILILFVFVVFSTAVLAQDFAPEPNGYREEPYRGPVPNTLLGATVIDTEQAYAIWEMGRAAFIDVLPRAPKPANLPEGTIWRDKPRHSIPSAVWLPNVGYGRLADLTEEYFRSGLSEATKGDLTRGLVFFCLEECWMSWNAAKRAVSWGYTSVFWYPQGTDGWSLWNHPLERVEPLTDSPHVPATD